MQTVVMVIAPAMFRDEEYADPRSVLKGRGAEVVTASVDVGTCTGKLGMRVDADVALRDVDPSALDGLVFVGGAGAEVFFDDEVAHVLVQAMIDEAKVVGAICIAPSILARAGVLEGRRATSFPDSRGDLESHGATYTGAKVEVDGDIVTANGPEAARDFGMTLADLLGLP